MKAIYWNESGKAMIVSAFAALSVLLLIFAYAWKEPPVHRDVLAAITATTIWVSVNLAKYYGRERKVVFDDENERLTVDFGKIFFVYQTGNKTRTLASSDISDLFPSLSARSGKREMRYSDIKYVKLLKEDGKDVLVIGHVGPWDTILKVRIYGKETGREKLWEIAREFERRSHDYGYDFEDRIGLMSPGFFDAEEESRDMAPYVKK